MKNITEHRRRRFFDPFAASSTQLVSLDGSSARTWAEKGERMKKNVTKTAKTDQNKTAFSEDKLNGDKQLVVSTFEKEIVKTVILYKNRYTYILYWIGL